jgi:hypothetical protein
MKKEILRILAVSCVFFCALSINAQAPPTADTLKQVLTAKLKKLTPGGTTERTVLYQEVRAGAGTPGSYPFQVTALVHDYGPGYPKNHYYGQTCVGHFDKVTFTLSRNEFGDWDVQGAMTPPMSTQQCKPNTAEGVSSIPLSTLTGAQAPAGNPLSAPAPAASASAASQSASAGAVKTGSYECWANGQARMLLNFTIRGAGQYTGSDGKAGTFSIDPNTGRIKFKGGALDGVMPEGFYAIYHVPQGRPTVSFRSPSGSEASFCQWVR